MPARFCHDHWSRASRSSARAASRPGPNLRGVRRPVRPPHHLHRVQRAHRVRRLGVRHIRRPRHRCVNPWPPADFRLVKGIAGDTADVLVERSNPSDPTKSAFPKLPAHGDDWTGCCRDAILPNALGGDNPCAAVQDMSRGVFVAGDGCCPSGADAKAIALRNVERDPTLRPGCIVPTGVQAAVLAVAMAVGTEREGMVTHAPR